MTDPQISIFGVDEGADRSLFRPAKDVRVGRGAVSVQDLADRMEDFVDGIRTVLARLPQTVTGFELDQITVSAEVSAKGSVSLLGSGGEVGGKGGITLTFSRAGGEPRLVDITSERPTRST